jgi:hypothetical protein
MTRSALLIIFMLLFVGLADTSSAAIQGNIPNPTGNTIIDQDTVWNSESYIYTGGSIIIGNTTKAINVTFKDCNNIAVERSILIGDGLTTFPVNFIIFNSTINWGSTDSELILEWVNKGNRGSILNISDSTFHKEVASYTETHPTTRALGLNLKSEMRSPYNLGYRLNTVQIQNTTFENMGRNAMRHPPSSVGKEGYYGAIQLTSNRMTTGFNYTPNSYLKNLTFWNCEVAIFDMYSTHSGFSHSLQSIENIYISAPPNVPQTENGYSSGGYGTLIGVMWFGGNQGYIRNLTTDTVGKPTQMPQPGTIIENATIYGNRQGFKSMSIFYPRITIKDSIFYDAIVDITGGAAHTRVINSDFHGGIVYPINNIKNITIDNCRFYGKKSLSASAILWVRTTESTITNNEFIDIDNAVGIDSYLSNTNYNSVYSDNLAKNFTGASIESGHYTGFWFKNLHNLSAVNNTFVTFAYPIFAINVQNSTFENTAISDVNNYGLVLTGSSNNIFKDLTITKTRLSSIRFSGSNSNNKFVNLLYDDITFGSTSSAFLPYYYSDIRVIGFTGVPVEDASISISNNVNTNYPSINIKGESKHSFVTGSDGKTPLPSVNQRNSIALLDFYQTRDQKTEMSYTFTVEKGGYSLSMAGIDPSSAWYREDPNTPTYTITAILPDEVTNGPSIIGFAPSEDNPFVPGSTKKFRVWADETLTSMNWYVDGSLVSSGSLGYNWNIQEGSHTIHFEGVNANGAVMQSWSISEEPEVPEEQEEPNIPVPESSGSGTSYTPSATSFTASMGSSTNFIVNTDEQFTSTHWYFDGAAVASGTTSYTQNWDASGSFTVRFDGADDLGTMTRTWNVVVTGSEYSAISVVPSASVVAPGETFSLDVYIDPKQPVTGAQLNLHYSTLASVTSVRDGGLFKTGGLSNTFQSGTIDNSAGVLRNVYSAIMGSGTVSTPGSMATVNMTAGASSGILELTLSNVVLSDAYSNPAPYDISYASVLVDTAPVFNTIPAISVEEESTLTFTVSATDADGDTLTYSGTSLPQGATFDASSKTFSWTPARGQAGTYTVGFDVTDGYLNDTATATITVTSLNSAPVITLFEPASGSEFEEGQVIGISVVAEDPEGEPLSYALTINGVQVSSSASYQWVTDYSCAGTHTIGVTVSDGNSQTSQTHTVTIMDVHPRWDVNMDGVVNILDITLVGQNYGNTYSEDLPRWDVNQDGIVNVQDLSIVAAHFGETVQ